MNSYDELKFYIFSTWSLLYIIYLHNGLKIYLNYDRKNLFLSPVCSDTTHVDIVHVSVTPSCIQEWHYNLLFCFLQLDEGHFEVFKYEYMI